MSKIRDALARAKELRERALADGSPPPVDRIGTIRHEPTPAPSSNGATVAPPPDVGAYIDSYAKRSALAPSRFVEIDRGALSRAGLLVPESQDRRLADEYRQIKRPLLDNANNRHGLDVPRGNLVMITSAVPGEGKSFTCVNLSLSLARERDWSVLLVDGDIAKGHLTSLLDLRNEPGLLDLLRNPDLAVDAAIVPSDIPNISILPAGQPDPHATELLASKRMAAIAEVLHRADPNRIVLFDSPPLLPTTEAAALATHMGQLVVVVKAGQTTHQQVQAAVAKLDPDKAISLILNQAGAEGSAKAQYGGYGYYGYGYIPPDGSAGHSRAEGEIDAR